MDDFLQSIYLKQAKQECEACFVAIASFNKALAEPQGNDPFVHAKALVHHAAAVSRIFWPPGSRDKHARQRAHRRGEALRRLLAIPSNHTIQARTLRDHFEHFDERLDEWAERSKNRDIVRRLLGPRSAIGGDAIQDEDIIDHYDPATKVYAFRGEKFDIQLIAAGLDDLYAKIGAHLSELEQRRIGRHGG
jgi:hypothetical protein